MRYQQIKLTHGHSTKAERRFMEYCKELHIPFRAKVKISGREVDFVIGRDAIEIDAHQQDPYKNINLANLGYVPLHLNNWNITPAIKKWLKQKYGKHYDTPVH
jgi:hypothetical protein